ncbi:MAG TPA: hypothetical protein VG755_09685 [Nannocystaceae bacterium]|nr:hypothetical protein [Nannocystaceae bacterium]
MDSKKFITAALLLCACPADDDDGSDTNNDSGSEEGGSETGDCEPMTANVPAPDEASCGPLATDYTPGADDDYPACAPDSGEWVTILEDPPGSQARVDAYEMMMTLIRGDHTPTVEDFVAARMQYSLEEGLESRTVRREDLHYPEIDAADMMAGVDFDKQCTIEANVTKYPDRCVGPAKIAPIISGAFDAAMAGDGDPNVHAARIDAGVLWFLWVSTYKESSSCVRLPEDCDAHHGYYDGNNTRSAPKGLGEEINLISPVAHGAVFDAMLAINCWRDLDRETLLWEDYTAESQQQFLAAHEQLDNALFYAWARLVRDRLENQPATCGSEADANWAFIQVAGPVLDTEAGIRDGAMAGTLSALWANTAPTVADIEGGIAAIDAIFPCPQCSTCEVNPSWGYDPIE